MVLDFQIKNTQAEFVKIGMYGYEQINEEWFAVTDWNYWDADKRTDSGSIHLFWCSLVHLLHQDNEPHHHISDTCVCTNHSRTETDCVYKLQ